MKRAVLLMLLLACAHRPGTEQLLAWHEVPHTPASLSPEQAAGDVDVLLYALREGYGGRRYVDAERFRAALTALEALKSHPAPSAEVLCRSLSEILATVPDNHLLAFLDAKPCRPEAFENGHVGANFSPKDTWHVDRACASSCESMIDVFERHPHLKTVGENTGGFVHFGNLGVAVSPHSGVVVNVATDFWRFTDGRYVEKVGYAPMLRVAPGGDALKAALDDLEASGRVGH